MLEKALGLAQQTSDPLAEAALLWRRSKQCHSTAPTAKWPSASSEGRVLPYRALITNVVPLLQRVHDDDGAFWHEEPIAGVGLLLKRVMDVVGSFAALVFLWPLMLLIALAVNLESPGPIIYRSLRTGKGGKQFVCYKFRTMVAGAHELKHNLRRLNQRRGPFFKIADDPRVTRLGRFLRKYSLDELPQFWNVLSGEMSKRCAAN